MRGLPALRPWHAGRRNSELFVSVVVASHVLCWKPLEASAAGLHGCAAGPHAGCGEQNESEFALTLEDEVTMLQLSLGKVDKHDRRLLQHARGPDRSGSKPALSSKPTRAEAKASGAVPGQAATIMQSLAMQRYHLKDLGPMPPIFWGIDAWYNHFVSANEGDPESLANKPVAATLLAIVVFPSALFAMTQTNRPYVAAFTWFVVDNATATLFAALLVNIAQCGITEIHSLWLQLLVSLLYSIFLLAGAVALAWHLRADRQKLVTCCNCAVYIVSFAFAHAASVSQKAFFSSAYLLCFLGIVAIMIVQLLIAVLLYQTKCFLGLQRGGDYPDFSKIFTDRISLYQPRIFRENDSENRFDSSDSHAVEWVELVEVIENDYAAIALGAVFSKCFYFLIVGAYPDSGLNNNMDSDSLFFQRNRAFLTLGGVLVVVSIVCLLFGSIFYRSETQYLTRRSGNFFVSLVVMSAAWTLHDVSFAEAGQYTLITYPVLVSVGIAALALTITLTSIFVIAWWSAFVAHDKLGRWVALQALSLMLGLSISEGISAAMEVLVQPLCSKIMLLLAFDLMVLLTYVVYLKPISFEKGIAYY